MEPVRDTLPASRIAALALAIANVVVLCLAGFQKWGYALLLVTFWWETVIVGFYNVGRIFAVCLLGNPLGKRIGFENAGTRIFLALGLIGFFVVKFGGFAIAMGLLVLFAPAALEKGGNAHDLAVVSDAVQAVGGTVLPAVGILFLSHGFSFARNFIRRREYERTGILMLLFWPYARLALLMVVVFLGLAATRQVPALARAPLFTAAVILLKLIVDMAAHNLEHRRVLSKIRQG